MTHFVIIFALSHFPCKTLLRKKTVPCSTYFKDLPHNNSVIWSGMPPPPPPSLWHIRSSSSFKKSRQRRFLAPSHCSQFFKVVSASSGGSVVRWWIIYGLSWCVVVVVVYEVYHHVCSDLWVPTLFFSALFLAISWLIPLNQSWILMLSRDIR